jgi:hypothetical protein
MKDKYEFFPVFLSSLFLIYTAAYLSNGYLPGNHANTGGWWTWWDQSKYLQSARAFSIGNLSSAEHWYPPGYALLAAPMQIFSASHAFFFINAACFLIVAYCFVRICSFFEVNKFSATAIFIFSVILNSRIFEQFVVPWTTTPTTALYYIIFLLFICGHTNLRTCALISFLSGLIFLFRPTDIITTVPVLIYISYQIFYKARNCTRPYVSFSQNMAAMFFCGAIGPITYLAIYLSIYGFTLSDYMKLSQKIGFLFSSIPFKLYVLFVDPHSTYDTGQGILNLNPWIFISLIGMLAFSTKNIKSFILILSMVMHICFYAAYLDLLPTGLWRYLNIHYFKWVFPFFGLFAWLAIKDLVNLRNIRFYAVLGFSSLFVLSIRLYPTAVTASSVEITKDNHFAITFVNPKTIQALDFPLRDGFPESLMFEPHELHGDGKEIKNISDFRVLSMPFGIRMLFHRPTTVKQLTGTLKGPVALNADNPLLIARKFSLDWGMPCWIKRDACPGSSMLLDFPYEYGSEIVFNSSGNSSKYTQTGWSSPEPWGRWTDSHEASLLIPLDLNTLASEGNLTLTAEIEAFVSDKHSSQPFSIKVNGTQVSSESFQLGDGIREISANIPSNLARQESPLSIIIVLEDPISPAKLGISNDKRMLGIGLHRIRISSPHS